MSWYKFEENGIENYGVGTEIKLTVNSADDAPHDLSLINEVQLTGIKHLTQVDSKLNGLRFTVINTDARSLYINFSEHNLARPDLSYSTPETSPIGGMWRVPPVAQLCDGDGRLMIDRVPIESITAGQTVGDYKADFLANDNHGLPCKMNLSGVNYEYGDRTSIITVLTDFVVGVDQQNMVDGDLQTAATLLADQDLADPFRYIEFMFDAPIVLEEISLQPLKGAAWSGEPASLFDLALVQGKREYSDLWEDLSAEQMVPVNLSIQTVFTIDSTTAFKSFRIYGKHYNLGSPSGAPVGVVPFDLKEVYFTASYGEINATFAADTLITAVVIPDVITNTDAYVQIEGDSADGDPVNVYYPAVAERFGMDEEPAILTQGLYASGHYTPDQTSVFIAYPPGIVASSLKLTIHDGGDLFQASMLLLYNYWKFETGNFERGAQTSYQNQSEDTLVYDETIRTEIKGTLKSRTVRHIRATDADAAFASRAFRQQLTCVLDSYPDGPQAKRYDNLIVGRIASSHQIGFAKSGPEFETTITERKAK